MSCVETMFWQILQTRRRLWDLDLDLDLDLDFGFGLDLDLDLDFIGYHLHTVEFPRRSDTYATPSRYLVMPQHWLAGKAGEARFLYLAVSCFLHPDMVVFFFVVVVETAFR